MKTIISAFRFLKDKFKYFTLTFLNLLIPKSKNNIFIFDEDFKKDNVWALAREVEDNVLYKDFQVYYYTKKENLTYKNIIFINSSTKAFFLRFRAKYIFYSYMEMSKLKAVRGQKILNTMHGSPLKNIGYLATKSKLKFLKQYHLDYSHILSQSEFFNGIVQKAYGAKDEQCLILGYPRNDDIFKANNSLEKLNIFRKDFKKIVLWVPTWRRDLKSLDNRESTTEFPILSSKNISSVNDFLEEKDILMIIKPHPFQVSLDLFKSNTSNIKIIEDKDLLANNVEFYSILNQIDALLTDYSSIYFDFLLTDKPIGFTIDDFESYNENRGFVVENPLDIMPGPKLFELKNLFEFLINLSNEKDEFKNEREIINNLANKYKDGNSSKRVLNKILDI